MSTQEAIKRAQKKYHDKFEFVRVRMTAEKLAQVKAHAEAHGESVSAFANRAIDETMKRDAAPKEDEETAALKKRFLKSIK